VSMYKAALQSDRDLVIDLYTAAVAAATGADSIPQASWDRARVFLPRGQRGKIMRADAFERVNATYGSRIYANELKSRRGELAMTFRASMVRDLERAECLEGASAVWSMWPGYLENPSGRRLGSFLTRADIPLKVIHASGHASVADLKRLASAVSADMVVPIHTEAPERFSHHFSDVNLHPDGAWWSV
jgi:ribonuclease J